MFKTTKKMAFALTASVVMTGFAYAEAPESDDPIIIVQNNWTSQLVLSTVVGKVLEEIGYTVEYAPSDSQLQFKAIADGDMHFQVEAWEGSMKGAFEKAVAEDGMVDAGTHDAATREEWWVPQYVVEKCPGLPDWKALDKCAEIFSTAETAPQGRFVGPPADWGKNYSERVGALEMNFKAINVGQAATLWAELDAAVAKKEPIVLFNWTPNYIEAKYEGMFIDFPDPAVVAECKENANLCGAPRSGWLKKAAWSGLEEKYPVAWNIIKNINFNNAQIAAASLLVDVDGMTTEEAADKWIASNQKVITSWNSPATN
ncbi:MAG: ABC transporter substrate-binding protein [Pseudomonadota bacterium]